MDEQTYLLLAHQNERSMYRMARSILWNDADAADAVQQAVFKGWINHHQLRDSEKFNAWILSILINECRNLQRKNMRQGNIVTALTERIKLGNRSAVRNEGLEEALKALPEQYRIPILLHYMEGYSIREIAQILDVPEKRVTERMFRGRRKLKEALNYENE